MTVEDLIEALRDLPPHHHVELSDGVGYRYPASELVQATTSQGPSVVIR